MMMKWFLLLATLVATGFALSFATPSLVLADSHDLTSGSDEMRSSAAGSELVIPVMNAENGRKLFASKGCVVCHAVNGIGGKDARAFDAKTMPRQMNPFEFAAKMWRGASVMVVLQRKELGEQTQLTGQELADIIAFVHNADEQRKFSEDDIPPNIKELLEE